jgi:hypothetical protein
MRTTLGAVPVLCHYGNEKQAEACKIGPTKRHHTSDLGGRCLTGRQGAAYCVVRAPVCPPGELGMVGSFVLLDIFIALVLRVRALQITCLKRLEHRPCPVPNAHFRQDARYVILHCAFRNRERYGPTIRVEES